MRIAAAKISVNQLGLVAWLLILATAPVFGQESYSNISEQEIELVQTDSLFAPGENVSSLIVESSERAPHFALSHLGEAVLSDSQLRGMFNAPLKFKITRQQPLPAAFDPSAEKLAGRSLQANLGQFQRRTIETPRIAPDEFAGNDTNPLREFEYQFGGSRDEHADPHVRLASYNMTLIQDRPAFSIKSKQAQQSVSDKAGEAQAGGNQTLDQRLPEAKTDGEALAKPKLSPTPSATKSTAGSNKTLPVAGASSAAGKDWNDNDSDQVYGPDPSPELIQRWVETESVLQMSIANLIDMIQEKKLELESVQPVDEAAHSVKLERISQAHQIALKASQTVVERSDFESQVVQFDDRYALLKQKMSEQVVERELEPGATLEQIQLQLRDAQKDLTDQNNALQKVLDATQQHASRVTKLPAERTEVKKKLTKLKDELSIREASGDSDVFLVLKIRAQEIAAEAQLEMLEKESEWLNLASQLLPLENDYFSRNIKTLSAEITSWDTTLGDLRRVELQNQIRDARRKAVEAHPNLKSVAERSTELAQQRATLAEKTQVLVREKFKVVAQANNLENDHSKLKGDVEPEHSVGNGSLLVEVRRTMPLPFESFVRISEINAELQTTRFAEYHLNEERKQLADPHAFIQTMLQITDLSQAKPALAEMAMEFVVAQREQIVELNKDYAEHIKLLVEVKEARERLTHQIEVTRKFIDKNALWIPSSRRIGYLEFVETKKSLLTFFDRHQWSALATSVTKSATDKPLRPALGLCSLILVVFIQRRLRP